MRTIHHSIDIEGAPDDIWRVLTDTGSYAEWNPFITQLSGDLAVGSKVTVTIRPGTSTMTFRPTILTVEAGRSLRWQGRLGVPGIFDGRHEFRLEALPAGGTRFTQRETFSGILVPLLGKVLGDTDAGFRAMNQALLERVQKVAAGA